MAPGRVLIGAFRNGYGNVAMAFGDTIHPGHGMPGHDRKMKNASTLYKILNPDPSNPSSNEGARNSTNRSIAIIGGGIAGLSAAWRAKQLNLASRVTLFEASPQLGGVLQTIERDGFLVERSADSFLVTDELPFVGELARELQIESQLIEPNAEHRRAMIVRGQRLVPVPQGFQLMAATRLLPLLSSPALPFWARLRAAWEPFVRPRQSHTDESLTSFITRRIGRQAFEYLAQPLVAGIYSADPDSLSAQAAIRQYVELEREYGSVSRGLIRTGSRRSTASGARYAKFKTFRRGMQTLIQALETQLASAGVGLRCPTEVIGLQQCETGWTIATAESSQTYDRLIISCSATAAARLLAPIDAPLATALAGIPYTKVAVVSLAVERSSLPKPLDAFGVVVPRREKKRLIAASFSSIKFPGRAPVGQELVRVFIGGALQPELAQLPEDELAQLATSELRRLLSLPSDPRVLDVAAWFDASPQYNLGHLERLNTVQQRLQRLAGLAIAGSAYEGVGLPQCVRSGRVAAEGLLQAEPRTATS